MRYIKLLASLVIIIATAYKSTAQSVAFLDINPDPKTMGNGGISAVAPASAFSLWNNSSATVLDDAKFQAGASYTMWQPDMADNKIFAVGAYGKITKFMAITAGFKQFSYNSYEVTNETGTMGDPFTPKESSFGFGLAFKVMPKLSVSADVNMYNSKLGDDFKASGVAFNIGATYKCNNFTAALTAQNLGGEASYTDEASYKMPSSVKAGASYGIAFGDGSSVVRPQAQIGFTITDDSSVFGALGAEYSFKECVMARVAYHYGDETKYIPSHLSIGAGVSFFGVNLNAAYLIAGGDSAIKNSLSISLSYRY